jgi:dGTPase
VLHAQTIVALIDRLVTDLIEATARRLEASGAASVDEVRDTPERIVGLGPDLAEGLTELKSFLFENLYHHREVLASNQRAVATIGALFEAYRADTGLLPRHVQARFEADGEARAIADYIAGMTDRFALTEQQRIAGRS